MKASAAYFLTVLLSAAQANAQSSAQCVEGQKEEISPGYTVEYKCNIYRKGDMHLNIGSTQECAELCKTAARSVCSYHPPTKKCIVGEDNGKDATKAGVIYMQKVEEPEEEDPFTDEDPFAAGCEGEKADCEQREADLQVQLSKSQSDISEMKEALEASCPSKHSKYAFVSGQEYRFWCARHHDPANPRETYSNVDTIADCVKICNSKTWCRWVHHGIFLTVCNLFDVNTSHTVQPAQSTVGWNSAVKK